MNRCRLAIAFLLVATLVLGGCSDDPRPKIARPSESSSPTVSESPSAGGPASPRDEQAAFIESYFSEVSASISTGDPSRFLALSSEDCESCRVIARNLARAYENGGSIKGGKWTVSSVSYQRKSPVGRVWDVDVTTARERWYDGDGDQIKVVRPSKQHVAVALEARDDRWRVREMRLQ